jgi:hypothetical protein
MIRCAIYARFSSKLQRNASLEDQIRQCRDFAARQHDFVILEDYVRTDRAITAASLAGEMPCKNSSTPQSGIPAHSMSC